MRSASYSRGWFNLGCAKVTVWRYQGEVGVFVEGLALHASRRQARLGGLWRARPSTPPGGRAKPLSAPSRWELPDYKVIEPDRTPPRLGVRTGRNANFATQIGCVGDRIQGGAVEKDADALPLPHDT